MIIRKAQERDISKIIAVKEDILNDVYQHRFDEMEKGNSSYLVADENNDIVGYIYLNYLGSSHLSEYPNIEDIAVRIDKRKQGIGSELIKECERLSKTKGFNKIGIQVNADPTCPAQIMYKNNGFIDLGNKPYLDKNNQLIIDMVKKI